MCVWLCISVFVYVGSNLDFSKHKHIKTPPIPFSSFPPFLLKSFKVLPSLFALKKPSLSTRVHIKYSSPKIKRVSKLSLKIWLHHLLSGWHQTSTSLSLFINKQKQNYMLIIIFLMIITWEIYGKLMDQCLGHIKISITENFYHWS